MLHSGIAIYPYFSLTIDLRDLLVVLPAFAILIAAQIFLSWREKRWPGLILPAAWLLWTLAATVPQVVLLLRDGVSWTRAVLELGLPVTAAENLPDLILLAIYAVCRRLRRRGERHQLKKTRIDDL